MSGCLTVGEEAIAGATHGERTSTLLEPKKRTQRQGSMTSHRRIVLTGLVVAALPAGTPGLAAGSPLLSGYGGPGQGSQAILGSTLLGGGAGPGGGSTSGGSGGSSGSFLGGERSGGPGPSVTGAKGAGGGSARKSAISPTSSSRSGARGASGGGASAYPASSAGKADEASAVAPETLGLSGDDLLYVLLALAGLAFTGVLTRQLARTKGSGGHQPLKGRVVGPE